MRDNRSEFPYMTITDLPVMPNTHSAVLFAAIRIPVKKGIVADILVSPERGMPFGVILQFRNSRVFTRKPPYHTTKSSSSSKNTESSWKKPELSIPLNSRHLGSIHLNRASAAMSIVQQSSSQTTLR